MKRIGWLISKYLVRAVVPYFAAAWVLISVILFVQQAGRYADIFFNANIPKNLIWQLSLALVPNIVAFTCPMALLVGVIVGLSRMQSDSELTAVRVAGVGNWQITLPIIIFGVALSAFTFYINLEGVPFAAKIVRKIALQTALYKLESPIEPGVFNTEINGYTIYVKDGDVEKGTWKNIFIYNEEADGKNLRLITSTEGRIDSQGETSELVLENANVNTISIENNQRKLVFENLKQFRIAIKTRRTEIVDKMSKSEQTPEELGLSQLAEFARNKTGREKTEAEIIWQRRIVLSLTPLLFAILGVSVALRFTRGGRSVGLLAALAVLLVHYLLTLLGEQFARTNQISVSTAGLLPVAASLLFSIWFFLSKKIFSNDLAGKIKRRLNGNFGGGTARTPSRKFYIGLKTNLLDFDIVSNLLKYFVLTAVFLTAVYIIFTAFELWKFAGEIDGGLALLTKYLFYLLPFVYIQLAPTALMVAALATFVVKSRQNEIVTWTAAGQSVYRLLMPCFGLMLLIGFFNWQFQEKILPSANRKQDELRAQIRSRGALTAKTGRYWLADERRIYSFEFADENRKNANPTVKNLSVYEFSDDRTRLRAIYKAATGIWEKGRIDFPGKARKTIWTSEKGGGRESIGEVESLEIAQTVNPFVDFHEKPSHLDSVQTKELAENLQVDAERRAIEVALQKKYGTPFLPFVITLFTAPFALSLSRKGKAITVGYSVAIWLLFIGIGSTFEQFGLNDFITPELAVWSPIVFFTILGAYLLTKVKT